MIEKEEGIKFLIENCYKNFPELMQKIPEEEMNKILDRNISTIITGGESKDIGGIYSTKEKSIKILNHGNVDIDAMKSDANIVSVFTHEGIHAMFRKSNTRTRNSKSTWTNKYKRFYKKEQGKI